jgi:para-nitrobenzyl esterase
MMTAQDTMSELPTIIHTDSGLIVGSCGAIRAFKGIPYAEPPVGDLRWRPPQPARPWSGIRDATSFGFDPPQAATARTRASGMNEDCLTLNIWAPETKANELRPVMV